MRSSRISPTVNEHAPKVVWITHEPEAALLGFDGGWTKHVMIKVPVARRKRTLALAGRVAATILKTHVTVWCHVSFHLPLPKWNSGSTDVFYHGQQTQQTSLLISARTSFLCCWSRSWCIGIHNSVRYWSGERRSLRRSNCVCSVL